MTTETRYMRKPVTRVGYPADPDPAEFEIDGNAAKPTAVTDPNVYPIPSVAKSVARGDPNIDEVEEFWQWQWRTDAVDSDAEMLLWFHNIWTGEWYPSALFQVKGASLLDPAHGGVFSMPGILGCDYIGVQVTGHAGKKLYLLHEWS